jgi:hypothetical protein
MKTCYFIDTEFIEHRSKLSAHSAYTLDLISIGIVSSDGREYYAQSCEFDVHYASDWVARHVYPHLALCPYVRTEGESIPILQNQMLTHDIFRGQCGKHVGDPEKCPWRLNEELRQALMAFMDVKQYGKPEFILWCGSYDYVLLCQLFGGMMSLPDGWPHSICDLQEVLDKDHIDDSELPPQEGTAHNALADARYIKQLWEEFG